MRPTDPLTAGVLLPAVRSGVGLRDGALRRSRSWRGLALSTFAFSAFFGLSAFARRAGFRSGSDSRLAARLGAGAGGALSTRSDAAGALSASSGVDGALGVVA